MSTHVGPARFRRGSRAIRGPIAFMGYPSSRQRRCRAQRARFATHNSEQPMERVIGIRIQDDDLRPPPQGCY